MGDWLLKRGFDDRFLFFIIADAGVFIAVSSLVVAFASESASTAFATLIGGVVLAWFFFLVAIVPCATLWLAFRQLASRFFRNERVSATIACAAMAVAAHILLLYGGLLFGEGALAETAEQQVFTLLVALPTIALAPSIAWHLYRPKPDAKKVGT